MDSITHVYRQHVERLAATFPTNGDLIRRAFLDRSSADGICRTLILKTGQTAEDGEYHNALIGFPLPFEAPSFCVVEVGCCRSVYDFSTYWAERNYDSYQEYVQGILTVDGKGLDLFTRMTGESLPTTPTRETASQFLVGHVLRSVQEKTLSMSALWMPATAQHGIAVFDPELLDGETRSAKQGIRHFVLIREEIEKGAVEQFLLGIAREVQTRGGISNLQGRVGFSVAGYDEDPRPLWDIPEVKAYFAELDRRMPFFLYYIANEARAPMVRVFLKMLVPPSSFEQGVPKETRKSALALVLSRLNEVTAYCAKVSDAEGLPVDPDETWYHALRCCGINIPREDVKGLRED